MILILMLIIMLKFYVKKIKQSDCPWKFCGRSVFHYSRVYYMSTPHIYILPMKALHPLLLLEVGDQSLKTKNGHLGNLYKISACGVHFYKNLQFMIMEVCCRQKNFSLQLNFRKFPLQLLVSAEAYLYVKSLTCCFESLWASLTTSTWNDWINVWLLFLPHHMQKTNLITQLILEIKLTHYSGYILAVSCLW